MNSTNNISARASFENAKRMFFNAFRDKFPAGVAGDRACSDFVNSLKLSQSEIRTEVQLTTTANQFVFGVTTQQNSTGATAVNNTENRLALQDSLCVSEYGLFVAKPASATDAAYKLLTYGNVNVFSTSNAAAAIDGNLYSNGQFRLTCNNDVLVPSRGLLNHRYVPQTQQSGVTASATVALYQDQFRGAEDGFVTAEPNIVLVGSKNYLPQLIIPSALAAVETYQRAVLIFRGILAQNSTVIS